jgi:hypothetical protein
MRLALLALAGAALWLLLRRRSQDERRVLVAWQDGSELELRACSAERERLVSIAAEALR